MGALQTFEASLRHAVRERQTATVGGGHFTYHELLEVLTEIMALRAEVAALSANAVDDTQAIERKDALLKQALRVINHCIPRNEDNADEVAEAIKQELSQ